METETKRPTRVELTDLIGAYGHAAVLYGIAGSRRDYDAADALAKLDAMGAAHVALLDAVAALGLEE